MESSKFKMTNKFLQQLEDHINHGHFNRAAGEVEKRVEDGNLSAWIIRDLLKMDLDRKARIKAAIANGTLVPEEDHNVIDLENPRQQQLRIKAESVVSLQEEGELDEPNSTEEPQASNPLEAVDLNAMEPEQFPQLPPVQEARPIAANDHSNAAAPPQAAKRARPAEAAGRAGPTVHQPVAGPSGLHGFRAPPAPLPLKKRDINQQSQPVPLVRGLDVSEQLRLQKLSQLEKLRAQGINVSVTPQRKAPPATQVKATNTGGTPKPQQMSKKALTAKAAHAEMLAKKKAETAQKTAGKSKKRAKGQRKRSAAATDLSPIMSTPETRPCEICFESVKKGSYNRHMKGHGR